MRVRAWEKTRVRSRSLDSVYTLMRNKYCKKIMVYICIYVHRNINDHHSSTRVVKRIILFLLFFILFSYFTPRPFSASSTHSTLWDPRHSYGVLAFYSRSQLNSLVLNLSIYLLSLFISHLSLSLVYRHKNSLSTNWKYRLSEASFACPAQFQNKKIGCIKRERERELKKSIFEFQPSSHVNSLLKNTDLYLQSLHLHR